MLNKKLVSTLLALLILISLLGLTYIGIDYYNNSFRLEAYEKKINSLNTEVSDLESIITELEILFEDVDLQMENKDVLLKQGYDRINFLEQTIEELEKEGKLDKGQIALLRSKLLDAKAQVMMYDKYRSELAFLYNDNRRMKGILDSISKDGDKKYEAIIAAYKNEVKALRVDADKLEGKKEILNAVESLKAVNFRFYSVKNGKKEQNIRFKDGSLKDMQVEIDLLENALADLGLYELYMAIRTPDATIMTNIPDNYGGTIKFDDKAILYSKHTSINYTRQRNTFSFDFRPSKSEPFVKGTYQVIIYCKGERIGEGSFSVI